MYNYVESKSSAKNVSWIVNKTDETTDALTASVLCGRDASALNFVGKLFLFLQIRANVPSHVD